MQPTIEQLEDRCVPTAGVDVYAFADYNQNGAFEPQLGETGFLGVLTGVIAGGGVTYQQYQLTTLTSFFTNAGAWYFSVPAGEPVTAIAIAPEGWLPTTPVDVVFASLAHGEVGLAFFGFAPIPQPQTVDVQAFIDFDVNGVFNEGDIGLEGVLIGLATLDGSYQAFQTTDVNGQTWFADVPAGTVYASAQVPPGLVLTTPATVAVTQGPGETTVVYFGFIALFDDLP